MKSYLNDDVGLGGGFARVSRQDLPVVEHALREGLSTSVGTQVSGETERLVDGQVGLHNEHRSTSDLRLLEYVTTTSVQDTVDTTHSYLRTLFKSANAIVLLILLFYHKFLYICTKNIS